MHSYKLLFVCIVFYLVPPQIFSDENITVLVSNEYTTVQLVCWDNGTFAFWWGRENGNISSNAEGINTNILLLHNISLNDTGQYSCLAENSNGLVYSRKFYLVVKGM